ncbi:MAG: DUF2063 domain-containing protein [Reyranellaceae bacterium]
MTALARLQAQFQALLESGRADIRASIKDGARLDRDGLLNVYRQAYGLRLHECLTVDFKAVLAMAGEAAFLSLARDYIAAHPSTDPNLRWFGRHFPAFLANHALSASRPAMAEMAHFEWALGLATDAADDEPLMADDLAGLDGEQWAALTFSSRAPVQRLTLEWQAPQAWLRHEGAKPGELAVEPAGQPVDWIVWRDNLDGAFRSLDADEAWAFDAAMAGAGFGEVCAGLCRFHAPPEAAARGAGLLRAWIDTGLLRRF